MPGIPRTGDVRRKAHAERFLPLEICDSRSGSRNGFRGAREGFRTLKKRLCYNRWLAGLIPFAVLGHCFQAIAHVQFVANIFYVSANCFQADSQFIRNFFVDEAGRQ